MKGTDGGFDVRKVSDAVTSKVASASASLKKMTDGDIHLRIGVRRLFVAVAAVFVFVMLLTLFCKKGVDIRMVRVKGGAFEMGCTAEQQGVFCYPNESPTRKVTVGNFLIGKYEVTQEQWVRVMGKNPSFFKGKGNLPVESVSWHDVQEFISKLNSATGKKYRLPTEAEWEFAARGGVKSKKYVYSGSNNIDAVAWYDKTGDIERSRNKAGKTTNPVGIKAPNELGIYDMSGNVTEWVSDWFGLYDRGVQNNPQGPPYGVERVGRGGKWDRISTYCRVSSRHPYPPGVHFNSIGFRLARDP